MEVASLEYTAKDIQVLTGLEAVRRRPGMYIGSTDQRGLHHLVYEIVDNAVDEAMAGFCSRAEIVIQADGSVCITDDGRGIPTDIHPVTGRPALETVMTTLHAGAKFGGGAYKVSGGLHGVGASVVNALSSRMQVEVCRAGKVYSQEYERGVAVTDVQEVGNGHKCGTTITFMPDAQVFDSIEYGFDALRQHFMEIAFLNKGMEISLISHQHHDEHGRYREATYYFEGGLATFLRYVNRGRSVVQPSPFYMLKKVDSTLVECAIQYHDGYNEQIYAFANCIRTIEGGSHLTGFRAALTRVLNDYARKQKLLKDDQPNLSGEDTREGLTTVISVKLTDPQFEGQTKTKLGNAEVKGFVESAVGEELARYLEEHPAEARAIIEKCLTTQRAREAARKARDLVIRKNSLDGGSLPGKLADCSERNPELCELFIVEGPSAGGSAKMGRDRRFQAILPIKGKILNVEKASPDRILAHDEIRAIITALGASEGEDFNPEKLRYHKIIIMTDADVDGSHIRTLLLTFFYRRMPRLIDDGYLYIAQPPLYRIARGRSARWIYNEEDKDRWLTQAAYGSLAAVSKTGTVRIAGKEIPNATTPLRQFVELLEELERRGYPPDVSEMLIRGRDLGRYRLDDFDDREELRRVRGWFEEMGYPCTSHLDDDSRDYWVEVTSPKGTRVKLNRALASSTLNRCLELYPRVRHIVKGGSYTVSRRDRELAAGVPWQELSQALERHADRSGITLQRYKGLGEMNPEQLWETTMNPETRTLLRVDMDEARQADIESIFVRLMGDEVAPRKSFIQAYARTVRNLDV